ncbi:MAG: NACHT domain-containing protein [Chloroflexi bacterium]|nr:NACHT domain-containing protein [Chloroflexota bacterium]
MPSDDPSNSSSDKRISIHGDVSGVVVVGDNNVVNKQTIIQKFFNIFKSDAETLEHRNRRILLGHVENAWIKGVLDASLHGAALLDLGIKQDPEAVTKYPWAIKKEPTDETLPAGTSMLEIFDSIGMGRSLLILGAPGSGKTTMLLELARGLIARAREDITQPIPMVFNLASWTEKLSLAEWLAQELNNLYSVPRKTAPDWVKGDKLLLLLDGLDEVRQESRAKCVEAINAFRKDHGLTSLAVCSRSQDYADLNAKLSFEGAIEVQPLTQKQIAEFFNRFGDEMAGIKQVLKKDSALREMAETPLFLSIMLMAYRNKHDIEILDSQDEKAQRKHLFDTYTERMFERPRSKNVDFKKQDILHWLTWQASIMKENNLYQYLLKDMQPEWLTSGSWLQKRYWIILGSITGLLASLFYWLFGAWMLGVFMGLVVFFVVIVSHDLIGLFFEYKGSIWGESKKVAGWGLLIGIAMGFAFGLEFWLERNSILDLVNLPIYELTNIMKACLAMGLIIGVSIWFMFAGINLINHYVLRMVLIIDKKIPWRLVPFLDHCVDLIFLRRVGGGYIFVHRLLMEHFAEMYVEIPTSKGN